MTCILELNDAALTLYRDDAVLHRSAGVAVVLDDDVRFGEEALRQSRIHPRQTNQQYLLRLNADPLPAPGKRARNHADLVYLHLLSLKPLVEAEGGEVLLAVPGILSPDQLGVLLGVLQEVGIRVIGFVDSAVAALSTQEVPAQAYHLDVMMQRAVVTAVEAGDSISKSWAQEVLDCGLNRLLEAWINVIADRFVRETRFDPLHAAGTEQQLFNQVYDWIDTGADSQDLIVEVDHADHTRRVELTRATLEEKAEQRLRQLGDTLPRGARVFLSARSARLPGLARTLADLEVQASTLPEDALARGCLSNLPHIVPADGELRLITRLPHGAGTVAPAAPAPAKAPPLSPTHALDGYDALPLGDVRLPLTLSDGQVRLGSGREVRLNGEPVSGETELEAGDRVSAGGREYLMIRVRET